MNYEKEIENLEKGGTTWKPQLGMYSVEILDEPIEANFIDKETGKETPQVRLMVRVNGEEQILNWFVTKGKTGQSVYGQLMYVGKMKGLLKGQKISVIINKTKGNDNKERNNYTIPEAITAMKVLQKPKQEVIN